MSESYAVGSALAKALDSPEHQQADREYRRSETRASLNQFFRLLNLPPEKIDHYVDLQFEMESRKADRLSALLHGRIEVAEALRERDNDELETERRRQELLGDEGAGFGMASLMACATMKPSGCSNSSSKTRPAWS